MATRDSIRCMTCPLDESQVRIWDEKEVFSRGRCKVEAGELGKVHRSAGFDLGGGVVLHGFGEVDVGNGRASACRIVEETDIGESASKWIVVTRLAMDF